MLAVAGYWLLSAEREENIVSAGLKNIVSADCCERKILFCQDINSNFVRWLASRQSASQSAEHVCQLQSRGGA